MMPRTSPALVWFWRIYLPLAALAMAGVIASPFAGRVEARLAPILDNIREVPGSVHRVDGRLCYDWLSDKHRLAPLENVDVFLERPATGDRSFPEVFDANTGRPWHRGGALPVKPDNLHRQCVFLPPDVGPGDPLVLRQTLWFRGWSSMWLVPVPMPDITSPGTLHR